MTLDPTPSARPRIIGLVQEILRREGISTDVSPSARLADIGLASMDMVHLMLGIEAEFDFMIPPSDITPATFMSVETIERMVVRLLGQNAAA